MFLDFCDEYRKCPFVVIVFRSNLGKIGDVRILEGKEIEVSGKIEEWNGRAEIILKDAAQFEGMAEKLPAIPKSYDADHHGNFSAGKYSSPKSKHPPHRPRKQEPAEDIDAE
jgi:DNA/RNA endonuclease YhcR with UshA esterase domain